MHNMGVLRLPEHEKEYFREEFKNVMERSNMNYLHIIDYDIAYRAISVQISPTIKCRYYFRYGIMIQYCYDRENEDERTMVGMFCFKTNQEGVLEEQEQYVRYWQSDITTAIPTFMQRNLPNRNYRILLAYTKPPFIDEDIEIVRQSFSVEDNYSNIPIFPRPGYYLIDIENYKLLVQHSGCLTVVKRGDVDFKKLPITQTNTLNSTYLAINVDQFWTRSGAFWPLCKFEEFKNKTDKIIQLGSIILNPAHIIKLREKEKEREIRKLKRLKLAQE